MYRNLSKILFITIYNNQPLKVAQLLFWPQMYVYAYMYLLKNPKNILNSGMER